MLWYDLACRIAVRTIPYVLARIGRELGLSEAQIKHLVPTERTLANACIDMQCLSELMVGDLIALASHRSFGFDGSTKFGEHLQTVQVYLPDEKTGKVRTLHAGAELLTGETAELGADAVIKRFEAVAFMGNAAGGDYTHVTNLMLLNFAGEAGGGEGVMPDHKEDATVDAIERRCRLYALLNTSVVMRTGSRGSSVSGQQWQGDIVLHTNVITFART